MCFGCVCAGDVDAGAGVDAVVVAGIGVAGFRPDWVVSALLGCGAMDRLGEGGGGDDAAPSVVNAPADGEGSTVHVSLPRSHLQLARIENW